jgi:GT2 family glycosyltransferase
MARLLVRSSMTAVTAACMMISRECLERAGPFDERHFAVAYNDVDFCLRARNAGFRTIYTPFATLVHNESTSRGRDDKGRNRPRFLRDQAALLETHATDDFDDPAYSPWYGRHGSEPYDIALDALPKAR